MAEERKYRIRVDGILVDVSKEVYRAYYSIERHTRTLDEKDIRNGKVLYSDLDTDELLGEDMIPDMTSERVEDSAIYSILREKLHQYRGDIYYADLRPVVGSEQGGIRPVVILQNNVGNRYSPTVIAAPITSRRKTNLPTHVSINRQVDKLRCNSVILMEQIRTIDKSRLMDRIGVLNDYEMQQVNQALGISVGLV